MNAKGHGRTEVTDPTRKTTATRRYGLAMVVIVAVVAPLLALRRGGAPAAPPPPPRAIQFMSGPNLLRGFLYEPAGGRAPAIVYNHGSEQDPDLKFLGEVGTFYQSHGFAVLFLWRQGCSGSAGKFWGERVPMDGDETDMEVRERRSIRALEEDMADVRAAIDYVKSLPEIDPARVFVAGSSFGGLLSLMAASEAPGIRGAVLCSGAAWSYDGSTPDGQSRLDDLARAAKVPLFIMQAENDFNQGSSQRLGDVMQEANLPHEVHVYPADGTTHLEGHMHFCNHGMSAWGDDVLAFLDR